LLNEHALRAPNAMTGRCFMGHPHVVAGSSRLPDSESLRPYLERTPAVDVLALSDRVQRDQRLLNASVQLRPAPDYRSPTGPVDCELFVRAEQTPNPDSRVILGNRLDRFGLPQPVLRWRMLEQDWDSVVRTTALLASVLERQHDARSELAIGPAQPWPSGQITPWGGDQLGTTRMADDSAAGVVDRDCLVHGTSNLYLAGSSVFPTSSCAEPTFTIVALAHRLADHLTAWP
jgi:choline dehydrogenase-like flavoprotein